MIILLFENLNPVPINVKKSKYRWLSQKLKTNKIIKSETP